MSAWMVSAAHIDVLIDCMKQLIAIDAGKETELGRMLLKENEDSLRARYDDCYRGDENGLRYMRGLQSRTYVYRPTGRMFTPGEIDKTIGCYQYQSCEHGGWEKSDAYKFTQEARDRNGYGDRTLDIPSCPWGWEDEHLGRTTMSMGGVTPEVESV